MGVVALVGGRDLCDVFDEVETLRAYWPRLVRSYALERLGAHAAPSPIDSARRLLLRPLTAERTAFGSLGIGQDIRISGDGVVGAALVCDEVAVHTALFRRRGDETESPRIRRPSQRAQQLEP